MNARALGMAALALLTACTNPVPLYRPGATEAEYSRDESVCKAQAERAAKTQMASRAAAAAHNRVLLACMRDRGWEQRTT